MGTSQEEKGQEQSSSGYSAESWDRANKYAKLIGEIPSSFSTTIRTIRNNNAPSAGTQFDKASKFMALRLIKSPTLKAPVYFAACTIYPEKLTPGTVLRDTQLLELFHPHELASILGMVYVYRRAKRVCSGALWENLVKELNSQADIGIRLGRCIPKIGPSVGVVLGTIRNLSLALFLSRDEKGFRAYRREVNAKEKFFDLGLEMKTWGCDDVQLSSKILQALGFGLPFAAGFSFGLTASSQAELESDPEYYRWHCASLWIEALRHTGQAPQITHKGQYYPLKADLDRLCEEAQAINVNGSKFTWLEKEKDALPPAMAGKRGAAADGKAATGEETEVIESDLPKEVIEELSGDEQDLDI